MKEASQKSGVRDSIVALGALACLIAGALFAGSGSASDAGPGAEDFRSLPSSEQQEVIETLAKKDPSDAWRYLISVATENGAVVIDAHGFGHVIGNALYAHLGIEGVTACTTEFAYACMHGVTEALFIEDGPAAVPRVEASCRTFFMSDGEPAYQGMSGCIHGAGHGLLTYFSYDIPGALAKCEAFSPDVKTYCYDGVFMEAAQGAPAAKEAVENDPWSLCRGISGEALMQCARYLPVAVVEWKTRERVWDMSESHTAELFATCEGAPREESATRCVETVGHMIAQNLHRAPADIVAECSTAPRAQTRAACLSAAATEISFQRYDNRNEAVTLLCSSILDENAAQECREAADRTYAQEVN